MDGFDAGEEARRVVGVAVVKFNKLEPSDPALRRLGRFDCELEVG